MKFKKRRKFRVKKVSNGYCPQYKNFLFWNYFTDGCGMSFFYPRKESAESFIKNLQIELQKNA